MEIRKLEGRERFEAELISLTAFHQRTEDIEKFRENAEKDERQDWGAFADDGTLMAHIINNSYESYFDGHIIKAGGIGAVSTLPPYREEGCIRSIFKPLLRDSYEQGMLVSTLYPFNHGFYRKFGYETATVWNEFTVPTAEFRKYHHKGWVKQWKEGDDPAPYAEIYEKFASRHNLTLKRTEDMVKAMIHGTYYTDRYYVFLIGDETGPLAYVAYQDVRQDPQARLKINDFAWDGIRGFKAFIGFLGRFSADYKDIWLRFPTDIELAYFAGNPYDVQCEMSVEHMVRAINAKELLKLLKKPAGAEFSIEISGDEFIEENNGTFLVKDNEVTAFSGTPDISMDAHTFSQLITGASNLYEASLRPDVVIRANEAILREIFVRKPLYMADHF